MISLVSLIILLPLAIQVLQSDCWGFWNGDTILAAYLVIVASIAIIFLKVLVLIKKLVFKIKKIH